MSSPGIVTNPLEAAHLAERLVQQQAYGQTLEKESKGKGRGALVYPASAGGSTGSDLFWEAYSPFWFAIRARSESRWPSSITLTAILMDDFVV